MPKYHLQDKDGNAAEFEDADAAIEWAKGRDGVAWSVFMGKFSELEHRVPVRVQLCDACVKACDAAKGHPERGVTLCGPCFEVVDAAAANERAAYPWLRAMGPAIFSRPN